MLGRDEGWWPGEFWNVENVARETGYGVVDLLHFGGSVRGFSRGIMGIGVTGVRGKMLRSRAIHGG
jgi:hypothetical protein